MKILRLMLIVAVAAALAGCESAPIKGIKEGISGMFQKGSQEEQGEQGEQDLASGVKQFEGGNYGEASRLLRSGLDKGLSSTSDQVRAHKYLAFIHCVSGRDTQCRNEFRAALKIDPSFDLAANEAGHPTWGPMFRSVKARR